MKKSGLAATFLLAAGIALGVAGCAPNHGARAHPSVNFLGKAVHPRGNLMPDGTVSVGLSPDTKKPVYTTPVDAPGTYTHYQAEAYCSESRVSGHDDWRLPSPKELNAEFRNRAAIGGFNLSGAPPAGRYWAISPGFNIGGWTQRFSDGHRQYRGSSDISSLRCVR